MVDPIQEILLNLYQKLYTSFGPQNWWPAENTFEMMVGAILTQNTNWINVEKTIKKLRDRNLLLVDELAEIEASKLAKLITACGYFNVKANYLKSFCQWLLQETGGQVEKLFYKPLNHLRSELLDQKGIGYETADSILLYGGNYPIFVIDNYTKRILQRHGLITGDESYEEIRLFIENHLPEKIDLYQEFHALIVKVASNTCKTSNPLCIECPLENWQKINLNI
ncbi:MAG: endonuclease [Planctomycetota bacterium]|nr:MAG: endonuclease [Planctomycetota bacterium]